MHGPGVYILLMSSVLVIVSILAGRFFSRYGFSTLLVTLAVGMAFGNGGQFDFNYNYPALTLNISEIALCFIIFAGGFTSSWSKLRKYALHGVLMATVGVFVTMVLVALAVHYLLNWGMMESLLVGAIISATDAAAVFSILESSGLKLKPGLAETLEFESGTNDPMAYFLTIAITSMITGQHDGYVSMTFDFILSMGIGFVSGYFVGKTIRWMLVRARLKKGQNPVMLIAMVFFLYAINVSLGGSAFLAVYVAGIVLSNQEWSNKQFNISFFEGFSWLMETVLFLILGLQFYLFEIGEVLVEGLIISAILLVLARPVATHISLFFLKDFTWKRAAFISWVGLRGATPIVFALIPLVGHVPVAHKIFNISFIVVITSIAIQGNIISKLARMLGLEEPEVKKTQNTYKNG